MTIETIPAALYETKLKTLPLIGRGKVRDIYKVGDAHLLIVTTDRISAFDVVLPDPIPGKGAALTALSHFWFDRTRQIVINHIASLSLSEALTDPSERRALEGRALVVRRREIIEKTAAKYREAQSRLIDGGNA